LGCRWGWSGGLLLQNSIVTMFGTSCPVVLLRHDSLPLLPPRHRWAHLCPHLQPPRGSSRPDRRTSPKPRPATTYHPHQTTRYLPTRNNLPSAAKPLGTYLPATTNPRGTYLPCTSSAHTTTYPQLPTYLPPRPPPPPLKWCSLSSQCVSIHTTLLSHIEALHLHIKTFYFGGVSDFILIFCMNQSKWLIPHPKFKKTWEFTHLIT
jgi:hypothetical protein